MLRWSHQDIAEALRLRKRGRSLNEISKDLDIPKSTLFHWLDDVVVPKAAQRRLAARQVTGGERGTATILRKSAERRNTTQNEALADWNRWSSETLFMLGIGLYWGEGDKTLLKFAIANADESLHCVFLRWFKRYAADLKLRAQLTVHRRAQLSVAIAHWRKTIGKKIPIRTNIAVSSASKGRRPKRTLPYGTLTLFAGPGATTLAFKMAAWIKLAKERLTGESNPSFSN